MPSKMSNQLQIKDQTTSSTELTDVVSFTDPNEHMWHFAYTFNFIGVPFIEPGFCTLEADPHGCVHGVAYRMRVMDFARLQQSEGGGRNNEDGYRGVPVSITLYDGRTLDALALQGAGMAIQTPPGKFLLPSRRYLHTLMIEGAQEHKLDANYIAWLQQHPCLPRRDGSACWVILLMLVTVGPIMLLMLPYFAALHVWKYDRGAWSYKIWYWFAQWYWSLFAEHTGAGCVNVQPLPYHEWLAKRTKKQ